MDIKITVIDRSGVPHQLVAPTDMSMNLMEVCKAYELHVDGICGGMAHTLAPVVLMLSAISILMASSVFSSCMRSS